MVSLYLSRCTSPYVPLSMYLSQCTSLDVPLPMYLSRCMTLVYNVVGRKRCELSGIVTGTNLVIAELLRLEKGFQNRNQI